MEKRMMCKDVYPYIVDEAYAFERYQKHGKKAIDDAIQKIRQETDNRMTENTCRNMFYAARKMLRGEDVDYISNNAYANMNKRIEEISGGRHTY